MDLDEMMPKKKPQGVVLGAELAPLSIGELEARLALIDEERARIEAEIVAKLASRSAAESVFRR